MRLFRRRSEQRTIPDGGPVWPDNGWAPSAYSSTPERALQVGDVWACVRVLADAAASVPLIAYRRTSSGRARLNTGRLAGLLDRPAPATTQANLVAQMVSHLALWGNGSLGKFRGEDGRVEQLGCLFPDYVAVELRAGMPLYTVTDPRTGRQSKHGTDDITHIRAMSTDGLVGLSPIKQCKIALAAAGGLGEFTAAFFENGGRPSGIITLPQGTRKEALEHLSMEARAKHGGARNAHRIAVITGEMQWTPMSGPLDDLQFVEQRKLSTAEIARVFRVPPWMIGASSGDSLTYSNVEQQQLAFVTHSLRPWLVVIEQALSADSDLCPGSLYVEFLLDLLLRADSATRADVYTKALDPITGWMRRDEVRRLENLEPEPEVQAASGNGELPENDPDRIKEMIS
jgi:HK97 family phage portal protein